MSGAAATSGPWEDYASPAASDGPWADYAPVAPKVAPQKVSPPPQPVPVTAKGLAKAGGSGVLSGVAGIVDAIPFTPAGASNMVKQGGALGNFAARKLGLETQDQSDRNNAALTKFRTSTIGPTAGETQQGAGLYHAPANEPERYAAALGAFVPNLLMGPEGVAKEGALALASRIGRQVVAPAVGSETARYATEKAGGGQIAQGIASVAGGVTGGALGSLRPGPRVVPGGVTKAEQSALAKFTNRAKPDMNAYRTEHGALSDVGIKPTLTDITDETGRGIIRNAASKMTPSRQVAQDFADKRALDLPGRLSAQAEIMSPGPQSAQELADAAGAAPHVRAQELGDRILGTATPQAGEQVSSALGKQATASEATVNKLYGDARSATPEGAHLPAQELPKLASTVRESVRDFDPVTVAPVTRELDRLDTLSTPTARDLFDARSRLTNLSVSSDRVVANAAGKAKRALDGQIDDAMANGLFTGDPKVVAQWRAAIAARAEHGRNFEGDDLIQRLTETDRRSGAKSLSVAPEDAANYILGKADLGFVGKANLKRDLTRMRGFLGENSDAWNSLRHEVYQRIVGNATNADGTLNGVALRKNLSTLQRHDQGVASILFSPQEQHDLAQIAADANRPGPLAVGARVMSEGPQFQKDVKGLLSAELPAARAAAKENIQGALGEKVAGRAASIGDNLSVPSSQLARNEALLGPDTARRLEAGMAGETKIVRNARQVAPNTGPKSANVLLDNAEMAGHAAKTVGALGAGHPVVAALSAAKIFLTRQGFNDKDAEALVRLATDPTRTNQVLQALSARIGPTATQQFARRFNGLLGATVRNPAAVTGGALALSASQARAQDQRSRP